MSSWSDGAGDRRKVVSLLNRKSVVDAFGNLEPEASTALSKIGVDPSLLTPQGIARLEEWFKRTAGHLRPTPVGDDSSQCGACGTGRHPPHAGQASGDPAADRA